MRDSHLNGARTRGNDGSADLSAISQARGDPR
jgi:hypothetical protein